MITQEELDKIAEELRTIHKIMNSWIWKVDGVYNGVQLPETLLDVHQNLRKMVNIIEETADQLSPPKPPAPTIEERVQKLEEMVNAWYRRPNAIR